MCYFYATPEHGILELKSVPLRNEDGVQFILRSSGIDGIGPDVGILEDTPEAALEQLCRVIERMFEEMYFYYDLYADNEDQIDVAKQAYAKGEEIWAKVCELVVAYGLYTSRKDKVSTTDCFEKKVAWFNFNSQDIVNTAKYSCSKVEFLENTWFPGDVSVRDLNHSKEPSSPL